MIAVTVIVQTCSLAPVLNVPEKLSCIRLFKVFMANCSLALWLWRVHLVLDFEGQSSPRWTPCQQPTPWSTPSPRAALQGSTTTSSPPQSHIELQKIINLWTLKWTKINLKVCKRNLDDQMYQCIILCREFYLISKQICIWDIRLLKDTSVLIQYFFILFKDLFKTPYFPPLKYFLLKRKGSLSKNLS